MMPLRSDIARREQRGMAQLPLNRQLIFLRVRQHILVVKGGRRADRQEIGPIDRRAGSGQRDWESLAFDVASAAIYEGRHELWRNGTAVKDSEGRVSDLVEVGRTLEGAVELAPSQTYARLAATACQRVQKSAFEVGRIGESDTGRKVVVARRRESTRDARVARENPTDRRPGEPGGLEAGHQCFELAVLFRPGAAHIPTQTVVEGNVRLDAPAVLGKKAKVARTSIGGEALALRIAGGGADQEISKIAPRFGAVEGEVTIRSAVVLRQLVVAELPSERQRVRADHAAEVVHDLVSSFGDTQGATGGTKGQIVVEMDVRDVRVLRKRWRDAECIGTFFKAERPGRDACASSRLVNEEFQARETKAQFIHRPRSKGL